MAGAALKKIQEELQHDFDRKVVEYEQRGEQRSGRKKSRDLLLRSVNARFGTINRDIVERIKEIQSVEILDGLFDSSFRVNSLEEFKEQLHQATDN